MTKTTRNKGDEPGRAALGILREIASDPSANASARVAAAKGILLEQRRRAEQKRKSRGEPLVNRRDDDGWE